MEYMNFRVLAIIIRVLSWICLFYWGLFYLDLFVLLGIALFGALTQHLMIISNRKNYRFWQSKAFLLIAIN